MRISKIVVILIMLLVATFLFVSCGGSDTGRDKVAIEQVIRGYVDVSPENSNTAI